jgi:LemA protein
MVLSVLIWVIIAIAIFVVLLFIYYYNKFVVLGNQIDNSLSQIDVQLRKRGDLVPNLLKTVKGFAKHERAIVKDVTEARKALLSAKGIEKRMKAGNELQSALKSIFALAEGYPDLKANQNFLHLQKELAAIEDKIAYSRQFYNDSILNYNNATKSFPGVTFANMYGKKAKPYLQIPVESRAVPDIDFN